MTFALALSVFFQAPLAQACTLPKYEPPKEWRECKKDDDCTFASDDCRMCENWVAVNKVWSTQALMADLEKRLASKCIKECKLTCDIRSIQLKCIDNYCTGRKVKLVKLPDGGVEPAP